MRRLLRDPAFERWLPLLVLPPVLLLDGVLSKRGDPVDALGVVLTFVAVAPLVLRHTWGFWRFAPLLVGGVVVLLWAYEPGTTVVLLPAWALLEVSRREGRRHAVMAAVAIVPCVTVSVIPFADDAAEAFSIVLRNVALCELAVVVGYVLHENRERLDREKAAHDAQAQRALDEERLRIAREVHDVVAHSMVAINVQAGVAAHLLGEEEDPAREALLQIKRTSGEALTDLRATLGVLRDPGGQAPTAPAGGLADLEGVAAPLRAAGVDVTVQIDAGDGVPAAVGATAYRIVQEALTNVLRHAGAGAATVVARAQDGRLRLTVADDGAGRVPETTGAGAGLHGMRERARAGGGTLDAGPGPDGGWRVEAVLPLGAERPGP